MAVVAEIAALKFKFEVYALPALGADLAFRLAIGETGLNRFDHVAQMFRDRLATSNIWIRELKTAALQNFSSAMSPIL
jgi:hypothetical protein